MMKPNNKKKDRKQKVKKKPIVKNKKEHVLVVAQEFKFARLLSGNEKKTRDRVLKALKKWLLNSFEKSYVFKEDDFTRVWKGLFYAMWMSDKPLIQEELCESIASILDLFPMEQIKNAVLMTKAGLKILATEWYGIDQHRMDKFMMFVRRFLRGSLRCLSRCSWSQESCNIYTKMLTAGDGILALKTPPYARNAMSMILHFVDCFLEELAKVSEGKIPDESLVCLLRPFSAQVCGGEALALCIASRRLLTALLRQSELGLQYADKEQAWQQMGCPPGGPEALELEVEEDDEQMDEDGDEGTESASALDPRAGKVDVVLPLLPVPGTLLAEDMRRLMESTSCASKAYKRAKICLQRFEDLSKNVYPLRVKDTDFLAETEEEESKPEQVAKRLRALEKRLVTSSDELALRGLSRKHRKRLLAKSRAGLSIMEDVAEAGIKVPAEATAGEWQIEETNEKKQTKSKKDTSNKENQTTNKKKQNKKRKLEASADRTPSPKKLKSEKIESIQKNKVDSKTKQPVDKVKTNTPEKGNIGKDNNKRQIEKKDKNKENNQKPITTNKKKAALVSQDINKKVVNDKQTVNKKVNENTDTKEIKSPMKPVKANKVVVSKVKNSKPMTKSKNSPTNNTITKQQRQSPNAKLSLHTPKKVKFVLKNNGAQAPIDYYKSVRQSPNIPFDSSKQPSKTNLKPSMPSPINPFFKKKLKLKK